MINENKQKLTQHNIVDAAAAKARRQFWWKVWILILVLVLFFVWATTR